MPALITAIVFGAFSQLLMKYAMRDFNCTAITCDLQSMLSSQGAGFLVFGIVLYFFSMLMWISALRNQELGFAYPLLAWGYVIVYLGASLPPLSEPLTLTKSCGIMLIIVGVTLSARHPSKDQGEMQHEH